MNISSSVDGVEKIGDTTSMPLSTDAQGLDDRGSRGFAAAA